MIVFNIQQMESFISVIPTCSTASCPKCSGNVTLKKHANSASIENMNDCLHHGFCTVHSTNSLFVLLVFSTPAHGVTIEIVVF